MGCNLIVPELSLNVKPSYMPKSISDFLIELTKIDSLSEKIKKIDDFVGKLEDEMTKIDAFKRELPLSVLIVNDAILALKEELSSCRKRNAEPILEEFIPLKKKCYKDEKLVDSKIDIDKKDKMNWMSSVQLWNTNESNDSEIGSLPIPKGKDVCENIGNSRTFLSFKEEQVLPPPGLTLFSPGIDFCNVISTSVPNKQSELRDTPSQQSCRKQRRCWSPELHRRFVDALEKLGGSQVATPKQIRDLMQVDGLTNDEVKSHLQKYRLHTRRVPTSGAACSLNQSSMVLGGLWLQKDLCGESSKQNSNSQSGSPPGPLQFSKNGLSNEEEDDDSEDEDEDEGSNPKLW